MGRQIIKQPNGKYAIWSSIVEDFIFLNITREEYVKFRVEEETKEIKEDIDNICNLLDRGGKPYYQFTKSFNECIDWFEKGFNKGKGVGKKRAKEVLKIVEEEL